MQSQRRLGEVLNRLDSLFVRLSTGQRINRASDDAAGLAIAEGLNFNARVSAQGFRNINDAASMLNVADGGLEALSSIVFRQRELAEQSANGVLSDAQRTALDSEYRSLLEEYNRVVTTTRFNGKRLLDSADALLEVQAGTSSLLVQAQEGYVDVATVGLGTYGSEKSDALLPDPKFIVSDFDNDGIDDLFVYAIKDNVGTPTLAAEVWLGEASGSGFTRHSSLIQFIGGGSMGMGIIEMKARLVGNAVTIMTQTADGSRFGANLAIGNNGTINLYTPVPWIAIVDQSSTSVVGDFNGDGVKDEVVADSGGRTSFTWKIQQTAIQETFVYETLEQSNRATNSIDTQAEALATLDRLTTLSGKLARARSILGAGQSRLQTALNATKESELQNISARSRITDADTATEAADLTKSQITKDLAAAILSQASLQPALALQLLGVE